jgi:uncharacterized protein with gpF-like domain
MNRLKTRKPQTLKPVRANAGIEAAYRAKLDAMIAEMAASVTYWVKAAYRAKPPEMAQDAPDGAMMPGSPATRMQATMRGLGRRWQRKFDAMAPEMAEHFAAATLGRADGAMAGILKRGGWTVELKMTAPMNDAYQAIIGEQVGLIKSISAEYLGEVEGLVMRSVSMGRDLGWLSGQLQTRYGVTKRRAALIARDQNNKATATLTRVRQLQIGCTEAVWEHSTAGKHPRLSHVKASGKRYDIAKGMLLDGEWLLPGEAINCRCFSRPIIPGLGDDD